MEISITAWEASLALESMFYSGSNCFYLPDPSELEHAPLQAESLLFLVNAQTPPPVSPVTQDKFSKQVVIDQVGF